MLVDLHGVAGHYLTVQLLCQGNGQGGLSGGGGAGYADEVVHGQFPFRAMRV